MLGRVFYFFQKFCSRVLIDEFCSASSSLMHPFACCGGRKRIDFKCVSGFHLKNFGKVCQFRLDSRMRGTIVELKTTSKHYEKNFFLKRLWSSSSNVNQGLYANFWGSVVRSEHLVWWKFRSFFYIEDLKTFLLSFPKYSVWFEHCDLSEKLK